MRLKELRWKWIPGIPALLAVGIVFYTVYSLYSTLPPVQGARVPKLRDNVAVSLDSYGVPTIEASSLLDAVRAQGYVTARDRLYQMELIRRKMEGRLSEIFGKAAVENDKISRFFNFRRVANEAYGKMEKERQELLEAYADGVNVWLQDHPSFEMKLLRFTPNRWLPADSLLVILSMFQTLEHWENNEEITNNLLLKTFPRAVVNFLLQDFGFFDASPFPNDSPVPILPPDQEVFDIRRHPKQTKTKPSIEDPVTPGSNAWAIPASRSKSGKPILSGDPHLLITLPSLWYRAHIKVPGLELMGASIPGIPLIVIGTNGRLAWSFTNADADTVDFVPIEDFKGNLRHELIPVRFGRNVNYTIKETTWGPLLEGNGQSYAVQWVALDPSALSKLDLISLNLAQSVREAFNSLERWSGPVQNCFLADRQGATAWGVVGRVPKRVGFDGKRSVPRDASHYWNGYVSATEMPKITDPMGVVLSSGNQRTSPTGKDLYKIGSLWPSPARGYRLKQIFSEPRKWDAETSASVQLDTLSVVHLWYRDMLLSHLDLVSEDSWSKVIKKVIASWDGRLTVDSAAYLFLKKFRLALINEMLEPLLQPFEDSEKELLRESFIDRDEWRVQVLKSQPTHWLPSPYTSFSELIVQVAGKVARELVQYPEDLNTLRWGSVNRGQYKHSLSRLIPPLSFLLDLPSREMTGDSLVPRVEKVRHSASFRFTIDMADPKSALYSQPGGQSGHPLSPHYKNQYDTWYFGRTSNLYPGDAVASFTLTP